MPTPNRSASCAYVRPACSRSSRTLGAAHLLERGLLVPFHLDAIGHGRVLGKEVLNAPYGNHRSQRWSRRASRRWRATGILLHVHRRQRLALSPDKQDIWRRRSNAKTIRISLPPRRTRPHRKLLSGWLLRRRKRAESTLITVVADCCLAGLSTRRVDKLRKNLGAPLAVQIAGHPHGDRARQHLGRLRHHRLAEAGDAPGWRDRLAAAGRRWRLTGAERGGASPSAERDATVRQCLAEGA